MYIETVPNRNSPPAILLREGWREGKKGKLQIEFGLLCDHDGCPVAVEWHMRQRWAALLFDDEEPTAAEAARASVVAPAKVSDSARRKAERKRTDDGYPVHSFHTLLADLATFTRNTVAPRLPGAEPFELLARPTPLQDQAFNLLGVRP